MSKDINENEIRDVAMVSLKKSLIDLRESLINSDRISFMKTESARLRLFELMESLSEELESRKATIVIDEEKHIEYKSAQVKNILRKNTNSDKLLLKVYRQVFVGLDALTDNEKILANKLQRQGLVKKVKIQMEDADFWGYVLAANGRACFEDKVLKNINSLNVPGWSKFTDEILDIELFWQAALINRYMQTEDCKEYIAFTLPISKNLLLACRCDSADDNTYYCTSAFEVEKESQRIEEVKRVIADSRTEDLIAICSNSQDTVYYNQAFPEEEYSKLRVIELEA